jgi:UDP-N-acetylglucosamine acyltransferase
MKIHPSAIVEKGAQLGHEVEIGPYCCVGPDVVLHDGVRLVSHVSLAGRTTVGKGTVIYPFASVGHQTQDKKYEGEPSTLEIGQHNTIREYATLQPGTSVGGMKTVVGDHCLFMIGTHVAHDCIVGNYVIMANHATLGGHVQVSDYVNIGGLAGVHQFVRIGHHAMIGGMSAVDCDVIPYGLVRGERAHLEGLNLVGLKRQGFDRDAIEQLRKAYRLLFADEGSLHERIADVASFFEGQNEIKDMIAFMQTPSKHGLCLPKHNEI